MNIAVFIKATTFHHGYGGLETQNKTLCEGLARKGHQITVFSPQRDLNFLEKRENGVTYVFVPSVYRLCFSSFKNNWLTKSYEKFKELHGKEKYALVVSQSSAGLGIIQRKNELGVQVVSISHGTILGELKTRFKSIASFGDFLRIIPDTLFVLRVFFGRQRAFVHGSNKIIAVSNAVKEALIDETFVDEHKIQVIHNGIEPFEFVWEQKESAKVQLIYVGRVIRSKGLFFLVEMLTDLDCVLDIVGDGVDMEALKCRVEELGVSGKVTFHGQLPYDQVLAKLSSADIFVFPTRRVEGFPMVLVEAMFAALPVVAFSMGGVRDAVQDGTTGYLLPENDYIGFIDKLKELIGNPNLRSKMSHASLEKARKEFTVANMLSEYEKIFTELLTNENS